MSQADLDTLNTDQPRGVLVHQPRTSIYMVLLGIAAGAVTLGCLILVLGISRYGPLWTLPWNVPADLRQFMGG